MKIALRVLPIVAAIGIAMWMGYLDGAKHRGHPKHEAAATK